MGVVELLLTAVALAMDAFAVSMCKGLGMRRRSVKNTLIIGAFFGAFQALMPLAGFLLGTQFARYITRFDHWLVFVLLAFIGGKMVYDAVRGEDEADCENGDRLDFAQLVVMAFATSVDALAVGISFAFLQVAILPSILCIGLVTFALSVVGVAIGRRFGARWRKKAAVFGGVVLMLIGLKILLEHLGVFG